jgi:cystathionine beta-lyase
MTHGAVPKNERIILGVIDGFVRLSVGVKDVEDMQSDLEQALAA